MPCRMDEHPLQPGTRYDFRIREANGRGTTDYPNLAFVGYGRWLPEDESQIEFAVVISGTGSDDGDKVCHHVWNLDRIVEADETSASSLEV